MWWVGPHAGRGGVISNGYPRAAYTSEHFRFDRRPSRPPRAIGQDLQTGQATSTRSEEATAEPSNRLPARASFKQSGALKCSYANSSAPACVSFTYVPLSCSENLTGTSVPSLGRLVRRLSRWTEGPAHFARDECRLAQTAVDPNITATAERAWEQKRVRFESICCCRLERGASCELYHKRPSS